MAPGKRYAIGGGRPVRGVRPRGRASGMQALAGAFFPGPYGMNEPRRNGNSQGFAVFVVIFMVALIGGLLYLAHHEKQQYDRNNAMPASTSSSASHARAAPSH